MSYDITFIDIPIFEAMDAGIINVEGTIPRVGEIIAFNEIYEEPPYEEGVVDAVSHELSKDGTDPTKISSHIMVFVAEYKEFDSRSTK